MDSILHHDFGFINNSEDVNLYDNFKNCFSFVNNRGWYVVDLPLKDGFTLKSHYYLCLRRLKLLHRKLYNDRELLLNYDGVIKSQCSDDVIQTSEPTSS